MTGYLKDSDLDFIAQLANFKTKLPIYAATLGITPETIAAVNLDADWMAFAVLSNVQSSTSAQDWTRYKNIIRTGDGETTVPLPPVPPDLSEKPGTGIAPNVEGRFRQLVGQIKAHAAYTKATGEDLGIEAPDTAFDPVGYKPQFSVRAVLNVVTLTFSKKGVDAMAIYSKVSPGSLPGSPSPLDSFTRIATDFQSPYEDSRPFANPGQPETREYYLRGIKGDREIGLPSAVIRIVVGA